jgi:hypothetical protein
MRPRQVLPSPAGLAICKGLARADGIAAAGRARQCNEPRSGRDMPDGLMDLYGGGGGNLDEYLKSVQLDCFADRWPR